MNIFLPHVPLSCFSVWFPVGARQDPPNLQGLAHMAEHLLLTKTEHYPTKALFFQELAKRGMVANASTSYETVHFYVLALPQYAKEASAFFQECLESFLTDERGFLEEKTVILDERASMIDDPMRYMYHLTQKALFPGSTLAHEILGTEESIQRITYADFTQWKDALLQPSEQVWISINGVDAQKETPTHHHTTRGDAETLNPPIPLSVFHRDMSHSMISINYRVCSESQWEDNIVLDLIREILANQWQSRLIQALRLDNSLTYWVDGWSEHFSDHGSLRFVFSVESEHVNQALARALKEIHTMTRDVLTRNELNHHKNAYQLALTRRYLTPEDVLWWYGWQAVVGKRVIHFEEYRALIERITPEQIHDVAKRYFTADRRAIVCLGASALDSIVRDIE